MGGGASRDSRLGWSLRSWVRKRFGVTSSPIAQTIIDNMQHEIKELKLESIATSVKPESKGENQSTPDLLAGSSHSRVIAPNEKR